MKYKLKKKEILRRFKKENYTKEEVLKRLDELDFDEHCDKHGHRKIRVKGCCRITEI